MSAKESIVECLKELVAVAPYSSITVSEICARAKVSRNTFYTHFRDKDDVLEAVLKGDIIQPLESLSRLLRANEFKTGSQMVNENFYKGIYENGSFYIALMSNDESAVVVSTLTRLFQDMVTEMLAHYRMSDLELEYMAYFYASSQAMLLRKWILDGLQITPQQICKLHFKWAMHSWNDILEIEAQWPSARKV
jgi:AcrR family transcriptional regulator